MGVVICVTFDLWIQEGPAFSRGLRGYWQRRDMIDRLTHLSFVRRSSVSVWNWCLPRTHISHLSVAPTTSGLLRITGDTGVLTTFVWNGFPQINGGEINSSVSLRWRVTFGSLLCPVFSSRTTPTVCSRQVPHTREFSVSVEHVGVGRCWIFIWIISVFFSSEVGHRSFHGNKRHWARLRHHKNPIIIRFPVIRLFEWSRKSHHVSSNDSGCLMIRSPMNTSTVDLPPMLRRSCMFTS